VVSPTAAMPAIVKISDFQKLPTASKNRFSEMVDLSQPSLKIIFKILKNHLESNKNKKKYF